MPITLLNRYAPRSIEVFAVTHNDAGHDGAASRFFIEYAELIKRVAFVCGRPKREIRIFELIKRYRKEGRFTGEAYRLERNPEWKSLYVNREQDVRLTILAPAVEAAVEAEGPNAASGILALDCGSRRIVNMGDATLEAIKRMHAQHKGPMFCDVLSVPHHGAALGEEAWIHGVALKSDYAVISVGSANRFRGGSHPAPETVSALTRAGSRVVCTQITPRCCRDLERLRPGVMAVRGFPSRSTDLSPSASVTLGGSCTRSTDARGHSLTLGIARPAPTCPKIRCSDLGPTPTAKGWKGRRHWEL